MFLSFLLNYCLSFHIIDLFLCNYIFSVFVFCAFIVRKVSLVYLRFCLLVSLLSSRFSFFLHALSIICYLSDMLYI